MPSAHDIVAPQLRALQRLEHQLQRIDLRWEVIETTACIVCAEQQTGFLSVLGQTRAAFGELATELVERIAAAHLGNRQRDLASKAQVAVDILTRNLFERTADVGFIATDGPLAAFVRAPQAADAPALRARLAAYRAKYSVYDDIVLLDRQARPLLRLVSGDVDGDGDATAPDWWPQAMGRSGWIERHGASGLFPGAGDVLLYAHRIEGARGEACGAVVLRFDLASELALLFGDLQDAGRRVALVFVDAGGRIVASNKPGEFGLGDTLACAEVVADATIFNHHGQDYLAQARTTRGYQGYGGLPWTAMALVRLDAAFRDAAAADGQPGDDAGEANEIDTDDARLQHIVTQARAVQNGLTRVIWNGKLAEARGTTGSGLHAVFDQIGHTGGMTTALFDGAIAELRRVLMAGRRAEMQAHAALAAKLMDRNLYERANDCRWWALSGELCALLAELGATADASADAPGRAAAVRQAERVLAHLNSLYTVYRRVALFDRQGRVVAVSRDADTLPAGLAIDGALLQRVLALQGGQAYAVSPMAPSALTDGAPTYLYCAALRAPGSAAVVGGIALAFDCATELRAMLRDAAPDPAEPLGFFVDANRCVVASADDSVAVGGPLPFTWPAADAGSALVHWQGNDYLAGTATSTGYREFKRSDGYHEPITALLLTRVRHSVRPAGGLLPARAAAGGAGTAGTRRYGIVAVGNLVLAIASADVVEAITAERLVTIAAGPQFAGMLEHPNAAQSVVVAIDARRLSGQAPLAQPRSAIAVVVRSQGRCMALLVDRLLGVVEHDVSHAAPDAVSRHAGWITGVISDAAAGLPLAYVIDPKRFDAKITPAPAGAFAAV